MDTLIVYLDDASYAQHQLVPMLATNEPTQWVLVACAPRMSHHVSKWLSRTARNHWRQKWSDQLFSQITPRLQQRGDKVDCVVAQGPLPELTTHLRQTWGAARVIDARRPKFGQEMPPVMQGQPGVEQKWQIPGAVAGMGAVLALASD
ncbi:MAG: hypothetical protein WB821_05725 [Burkholderiaceae bacterium]